MNRVILSGQLAVGSVHDFNPVLNIIRGYCELLLGELEQGHGAHERVLQIRKAADQGASLVQQILAFSKNEMIPATTIDVNDLIADLGKTLKCLFPSGIKLSVDLGWDVCPVKLNAAQFRQIIMNLVLNARNAMPCGGCLTIRTAQSEAEDQLACSSSPERPHRCVVVEVADTGQGIEPHAKSRIFEPFFTTQTVGGTGLGLANVQEIVKRNGGHLCVESEPGKGSIFRVFLPCVARTNP